MRQDSRTATGEDSTTALDEATRRVPTAYPDETVRDILHQMSQAERYDSMADVAVIETGRLVGLIAIQRLFAAYPDTRASKLMDHEPPLVGPAADGISVASRAKAHRGSSVGVVDSEGLFLGLIPPGHFADAP